MKYDARLRSEAAMRRPRVQSRGSGARALGCGCVRAPSPCRRHTVGVPALVLPIWTSPHPIPVPSFAVFGGGLAGAF